MAYIKAHWIPGYRTRSWLDFPPCPKEGCGAGQGERCTNIGNRSRFYKASNGGKCQRPHAERAELVPPRLWCVRHNRFEYPAGWGYHNRHIKAGSENARVDGMPMPRPVMHCVNLSCYHYFWTLVEIQEAWFLRNEDHGLFTMKLDDMITCPYCSEDFPNGYR